MDSLIITKFSSLNRMHYHKNSKKEEYLLKVEGFSDIYKYKRVGITA